MLLLNLTTGLAFGALAGMAPPQAAVVARHAVVDSEPVLTVDALTHMTTFWTRFMKEPDSIKTDGRKANQKPITLLNGVKGPGVVNIVAMAAKYPTVAADLKESGLTAQQWEDYRVALFNVTLVTLTQQSGAPLNVPAGSVTAKNMAFLDAHPQELAALKATGMWFPKLQQRMGGGAGGDLTP